MPFIHPLSIVDPLAELGEGVYVGPYCLIEGRVVIGANTRLLHHVSLHGPMTIGAGNVMHPFTSLGGAPQHRGFNAESDGPGSVIGDGNTFREGFTLNRGSTVRATTIGNRNYFMANSHVGHDSVVGSDCNLANSACLAGHVTLADSVFLGGNSGVHQHCRVGRMAMLSGGMVVVQDLAPFCISYSSRTVGSLNLVGLRRAGLREHIGPLTRAFDALFRQHHSTPHALELIEAQDGGDALVREFVAFVRLSHRGMTRCELVPPEQSIPAPVPVLATVIEVVIPTLPHKIIESNAVSA